MVFKNGAIDGYAYYPCYRPGWNYIALGLLHFGDFRNMFLPKIGEDQKKSHHLSVGPLALCHTMVNPVLVIALLHKKIRCGAEIANFSAKTLNFYRVVQLNWLAKIELRGDQGPWLSILFAKC